MKIRGSPGDERAPAARGRAAGRAVTSRRGPRADPGADARVAGVGGAGREAPRARSGP